jgi:hypothetical protein
MSQITSHTKAVSDLTASEKATMFGLLSLEFHGTSREDFVHDLKEKEAVALLRKDSERGEIVGFSTLMTLDLPLSKRKVKAIFSGDTTVLPEFRKSIGMGLEIGRYFLNALAKFKDHEIYYLLISKGWRTYKILPFFFREFAPRFDRITSGEDKMIMDAFGFLKYPENYDPETGLIMFTKETQRLVPQSIDAIPPSEPDPHIQFFLRKNPTYLSGTELVCTGRVANENFALPFKRVLKHLAPEGHP